MCCEECVVQGRRGGGRSRFIDARQQIRDRPADLEQAEEGDRRKKSAEDLGKGKKW